MLIVGGTLCDKSSKRTSSPESLRPTPETPVESISGRDDGYKWHRVSNEALVSLCKDLARRLAEHDPRLKRYDWKYYYDAINEFYNTDDPNVLSQQIASIAALASAFS